MEREEIRNKVLEHLKNQVAIIQAEPHRLQQFQLGWIDTLFSYDKMYLNGRRSNSALLLVRFFRS